MESYSQTHRQLGKSNTSLYSNFACNCRYNTPRRHPSSRSPDKLEHEERCPVFFVDKRSRTISGNIRVFSTLFRWKVSIRYSRFLLRDLQVQPNFTVTAIHDSSPAFQLIHSLAEIHCGMGENEVEEKLLIVTRGIQQTFIDHKAWPTDVLTTDSNILHISQI